MRLLPLDTFAHVFEPLRTKKIGFVKPIGNVGDELIAMATVQLFAEFGIDWTPVDPMEPPDNRIEEVVFGGGGNMGSRYRNNWELRQQILSWGLPVTILPQSFTSPEAEGYHRIYVRERRSLQSCPGGILAPDLALGLIRPETSAPVRGTGVFLRRDSERAGRRRWLYRDPVRLCRTPAEYLNLASCYERIITDRLHFAICGLLTGRDTTLLPNDYHKNEAMYETWLKDLGCRFCGSPREAKRGVAIRARSSSRILPASNRSNDSGRAKAA